MAVDTLDELLMLKVTPADGQVRAQVTERDEQEQKLTGESVHMAQVDHECSGAEATETVTQQGIRLEVIKNT